ncbi:MAG: hypothetical protein FJY10_04825 [Bacteroidetes bacterium]|nr:hypothetical protein [Bacteroidota bacterium]
MAPKHSSGEYRKRHKESLHRAKMEMRAIRRKARKVRRRKYWENVERKWRTFFSFSFLKRKKPTREQIYFRKKVKRDMKEIRKRKRKEYWNRVFKGRQMGKDESVLRRKIKSDYYDIKIRNLKGTPDRIKATFRGFWKKRVTSLKYYIREFKTFIRKWNRSRSDVEAYKELKTTLVNSTSMYLLSFFILYFLNQLAIVLVASMHKVPTTLFFNNIWYQIPTLSNLWTRKGLVLIFGIGPLITIVLGIIAIALFNAYRNRFQFFKVFLLWTAFHCMNFFFGAYIVGVATRTGFIYVSEWIFLSNIMDVEEVIFMILSFTIMLGLGSLFTNLFLKAANSKTLLVDEHKLFYLIFQAFLPWIIGSGISLLFWIPGIPIQNYLIIVTPLLMLIPMFATYNSQRNQIIQLRKVLDRFAYSWPLIIFSIIFLIAMRLVFNVGIGF